MAPGDPPRQQPGSARRPAPLEDDPDRRPGAEGDRRVPRDLPRVGQAEMPAVGQGGHHEHELGEGGDRPGAAASALAEGEVGLGRPRPVVAQEPPVGVEARRVVEGRGIPVERPEVLDGVGPAPREAVEPLLEPARTSRWRSRRTKVLVSARAVISCPARRNVTIWSRTTSPERSPPPTTARSTTRRLLGRPSARGSAAVLPGAAPTRPPWRSARRASTKRSSRAWAAASRRLAGLSRLRQGASEHRRGRPSTAGEGGDGRSGGCPRQDDRPRSATPGTTPSSTAFTASGRPRWTGG